MAHGVPKYREKLRSHDPREEADESGAVCAAAADHPLEKASSLREVGESPRGSRWDSRSATARLNGRSAKGLQKAALERGVSPPTRNVRNVRKESDVASLTEELQSLGKKAARLTRD